MTSVCRSVFAAVINARSHLAGLSGSGMDIPPMIRQSFPLRTHACVMRRVCAAPSPRLSTHLSVIQ